MKRWALALTLAALGASLLATSASGGASGRSFEGTWQPPPGVGFYKVTNTEAESGWTGELVDGTLICQGAPDHGDAFWTATQSGAILGAGVYEGRVFTFQTDNNGENCQSHMVRAKFWSPADDRLRICPAPFDAPESEPVLDTQSPVDQSDNCTDFRRTTPPATSNPKPHKNSDYIGKIRRDANRCPKNGPRDYSARLKYVADDPTIRVDVFVKRKASHAFKPYNDQGTEVNHFFVPTASTGTRVLSLPWTKKGKSWWRFRVTTQSGKKYKRTRAFGNCH